MARLTSKSRDKLPGRDFAGPARSFPIPDKSHARAALQDLPRAKHLTGSEKSHIRRMAHEELDESHTK